jgi:SAM-dependent methyltransferase
VASSDQLPVPPFELATRVGSLQGLDDPTTVYELTGQAIKNDLIGGLPEGYSLDGRRILDFGCGAGRTLRHFISQDTGAELWGCDIDQPSIDWLQGNLAPPLNVFANGEAPPLDQPDGKFDLIYCVSVFSHLTRYWAEWLLELHRLLKPDGLLLATVMGSGFSQLIAHEEWDEDRVGMMVLYPGQDWSAGGPMVFHSPWWLEAHWGRAFDILSLGESGFAVPTDDDGQGLVVMRRKDVQLTPDDLRRVSDDPREAHALDHNVDRLMGELEELRPQLSSLNDALVASQAQVEANSAVTDQTQPVPAQSPRLSLRIANAWRALTSSSGADPGSRGSGPPPSR